MSPPSHYAQYRWPDDRVDAFLASAEDGATDEELASEFGVSVSTAHQYRLMLTKRAGRTPGQQGPKLKISDVEFEHVWNNAVSPADAAKELTLLLDREVSATEASHMAIARRRHGRGNLKVFKRGPTPEVSDSDFEDVWNSSQSPRDAAAVLSRLTGKSVSATDASRRASVLRHAGHSLTAFKAGRPRLT